MVRTAKDYERLPDGSLKLMGNPNPQLPTQKRYSHAFEVPSQFNLTDIGNSKRLIGRHGENLRFCYETGHWLVWDGKVWARDTGAQLMALAKETVISMYDEVSSVFDTQARKALVQHAQKSESEVKLQAMISLARDLVPIKLEELDSNKMLFNCQNGTIDLRTGTLMPHKREDYITQISPVEYDQYAECPLWQQHLKRVTGNSEELIAYLQRVFGYCLTGDTREQSMFFIHGRTKTGKSVTVKAIMNILGDYCKQTPSETLLVKRFGNHKDTARLVGSRMVVAVESERGEKLASALIKNLTGGDRIAARFLYKENFEFEPTFKIFLVANDKPAIRGEDSAMWERIKLIPFNQFIPMEERDKELGEKLREEIAGILNWMVEGCLEWQKYRDLVESEIVTNETAMYQDEMDILADFLDDCCVIDKGGKVSVSDLHNAYSAWCKENEEEPLNKRAFHNELTSRQFYTRRGAKNKRIWHGLSLKSIEGGYLGYLNTPENINSLHEEVHGEFMQTAIDKSPKSPIEAKNDNTDARFVGEISFGQGLLAKGFVIGVTPSQDKELDKLYL